jgi:hypothetical protein
MNRTFSTFTILVLGIVSGAVVAETIPNWAAPPTWTPSASSGLKGLKGALATTYAAVPFISVTPCRVADTRAGSGFPAGYGPPSMPGVHAQRSFTIWGQCGIPTNASAVSLNFTVWAPVTRGDIRVFPAGDPVPTAATLNWEAGILALANAAVVPLGTGGAITVQVDGPGTIDLIVDVNGYYSPDVSSASSQVFQIVSSGPYGIWGKAAQIGVVGEGGTYGVAGTSSTGAGVYGMASSGAIGVLGSTTSGIGVNGISTGNIGVRGDSTSGVGVYGVSSTNYGVQGESSTSNGVRGVSNGAGLAGVYGLSNGFGDGSHGVGGFAGGTGVIYGVQGQVGPSAAAGSAGIHGIGASLPAGKSYGIYGETADGTSNSAAIFGETTGVHALQGFSGSYWPAGIMAKASGSGVLAFSNTIAVFGRSFTTGGAPTAAGGLGDNAGTTTYGVYGLAGETGTVNWGVYAFGDIGASGTKPFVEPHPYKAGTVIRYVALEGPEAGTYFRGRGRFVGGKAVIEVPEDFRLVTDEDGLTMQVTPVGRASAVGAVSVVSMDLNRIEVESTRDVEFFYHVNGIRKTFKDWKVVVESGEFTPESPTATIPTYFSEKQKRNLIENGTYNEDGTVNMQTAERLGWAQVWAQRNPENSGRHGTNPEK